MGTALRTRQRVLDDLLAHARETLPDECCGLIIGTRDSVESAVRARNLHASPSSYLIDPADHFAAIRMARRAGLSVIGAYHSHPASAPFPSQRDIAEWTSPGLAQVIVWPGGPDARAAIRAFHLGRGGVEPIDLVLVA